MRRRATLPPGRLAWEDATCARCDELIQRLVHQIVMRHGEWIHTHCASGGERDE